MASYFTDPDGDALTFTAASSNAATASVSVSGSVVTVTAAARGIATVTVTARDPGGMSAQLTFTVTVPNQAPIAVDAVPAQSIFVGDTASVDVSAYFNDPDGDALTYSVANSDATAVSASVAGSAVSLTAITQGIATVTVTASDPDGLSAEQDIAVTVPNRAPTALDTIPSRTLLAGNTLEFDLARYFTDPDGDSLTFTAASANVGVASVESVGSTLTITARTPGSTRVTVTVADPAGMAIQQLFAVTVPNREPVAIGSIPGRSVEPQQAVTVDVFPFFDDPDGEALSYAAASSNRGVATAAVAGATVTLTGVAVGTASITVTATDPGGLTAQQRFSVTVRAANDAPQVVSTIPDLTVTVDEVRAWRGADHFRDPNGDPLTYAAGSSNAAVVLALVSGSEFGIGAVSVGSAVVTVTASDPGGLSAQLNFRVTVRAQTQAEVVISGVEPAVLVEGASARITGSGFSATAAQNQVSVGGLAAKVTAASPTTLSIVVPWSDCLPARREELRVAVGTKSDARTVGVTPQSLELEPNHYWYTYGGNGCLHLPRSASRGEYLIGVTSISEHPPSLTGVTLTGTPWDASVVAAESGRIVVTADGEVLEGANRSGMAALAQGPFSASAPFAPQPAFPMEPAAAGGGSAEWPLAADTLRMRRARAHNKIMARNEELLRRLGRAPRPAFTDTRRDMQVGDTLTLYADFEGTCSEAGQVRALVRLVGNSSIWLDDLDNPASTFTDTELANLDAFYVTNIKGVHDDYFGGLSDVDGNGRFLVLMTKEVNREPGLGGWVWFGDIVPKTRCPTSNYAEIFYGQVPDPHGVVGAEVSKHDLLEHYPQLIAHEVTHLIQANAGIHLGAGRPDGKTSWEKEGGASLAEQLVAYRLFGHGSRQELGWSAYTASQDGRNWYWRAWVADMAAFFGRDWRGDGTGRISRAPEECSWVGREREGNSGPCLGNAVYGVPSMVLRYAMDRWGEDYPGGERALMRRLTVSSATGFASLVDVSPGREWRAEQILADFYITLWLDLQPGRRTYGMSTWDLYDLFRRRPSNWQLQPYTSSSHTPRLTGRRVRAGSSLYFHWTPTGTLRATSIKVTSPGGGRLPNHISVWALRVR